MNRRADLLSTKVSRGLGALCLLLVTAVAACTSTPPPQLTAASFGSAIRTGQVDVRWLDFSETPLWGPAPFDRREWRAEMYLALGAEALNAGCEPERLRAIAALPWLALAAGAPDPQSWTEDAGALRQAESELETLVGERISGGRDERDNNVLGPFISALGVARDRRSSELFRRIVRDQSLRTASPPTNLPPRAAEQWPTLVASLTAAADCSNTLWLREQLDEIPWFGIPTYGENADRAAWLIAQHADRTPDFQRFVLARLEALPHSNTDRGNLAYLFDRIAVAEGRPQRYGTQLACVEGSFHAVAGIEDASNVDVRRREAGLNSLGEYVRQMNTLFRCPPT